MAIVIAKLKPQQGGSEFEARNIQSLSWGVSRQAGPNGHVGMRGHDISTISFSRLRSLQDGTVAEREDELIKLAAGLDKKAYCSAEITVAPPDDESNVVQTIRWNHGFISGFSETISEFGIQENFEVTATDLEVDDHEFKRGR